MVKNRFWIYFLFIGLLVYWLAGLFSPAYAQNTSSPVLSIASPKEGTTILGDTVTISFVVGNFTFNEGHVHLWIDEENTNRQNAEKLLSQSPLQLKNLSPGKHMIRLEVVGNNHSPFTPPLTKTVYFTIKYPTRSLLSVYPTRKSHLENIKANIRQEHIIILIGIIFIIIGIIVFILGRRRF